jgi:hypothetical protein
MKKTLAKTVCIFGSRDWPGPDSLIRDEVTRLAQSTVVVVGGARGVDTKAEDFARQRGLTVRRFNADWATGKGAGFDRNSRMVEASDCGIAFWDGKSPGTRDTIRKFGDAGKNCVLFVWGNR